MKIVIVAYGHADNVLCLSKALSRYAEVTVIFITSGDRFTASLFDWDISRLPFGLVSDCAVVDSLVGERIKGYLGSSVNIVIARTPTRKIFKDFARVNTRFIKVVAEFINNSGYDIVHFNGSSGFQIYFQRYLGHIGKVFTIHDYLPHSGEASFRRKWFNILLNRLYTRSNYEFIQHYRHLSKEFARYYRVSAKRVHTVSCGPLYIYRIFAGSDVCEEPFTMLFFGRISPYKGLEYLFGAFSKIREVLPNAKLIIAGDGALPKLNNAGGKYEIYNSYVANEQLVRLIKRAAIVVAPYTDATHSAVIMTAYAFNKPIVASNIGGIPEVVEDNVTGRLVPPRDAAALADALMDLLRSPKKRRQMAKNILERTDRGMLSWDYIAKKTLDVYNIASLQG